MDDQLSMIIPMSAVICAAQHFVAAHESACTGQPVDWGEICSKCRDVGVCQGHWETTAAPIFEAADAYPKILMP